MELINREKEEVDINLLSPLTWAYVGDAVYELYIRTNLVNKTKLKPQCNTIIDKCYSNNTKRWLVKFRGVATKYLDHYLYFRLFNYKNNRALIEENDVDYKSIYEVNSYIAWKNIKLNLSRIINVLIQ